MKIDLHVHTVKGSPDSNLSPGELVKEAKRIGLDGVCLTEHGGGWDRDDFLRFARNQDLLILRAMEIETDMGHIGIIGVDGYKPGMAQARELRKIADYYGGFMVSHHPFRGLFNPPPYNMTLLYKNGLPLPETVEEAVDHPVFELVDAVEVLNGATADTENDMAYQVAQKLGKSATAGSDAHSIHGLGRCVTVFDRWIANEAEFLEELKAGRFYPADGLLWGDLKPYRGVNGHSA